MNDRDDADRLDRIEKKLDTLIAMMRAGTGGNAGARAARPASNGGDGGHDVATDADLDGQHGNPQVRFSPRRWTGADFKGKHFAECEPEFLDMLAEAYEWFAQRDDESSAVDKNGQPKSRWSRLDASRARGWAARIRNGGAPRPAAAGANGRAVRRGSVDDEPASMQAGAGGLDEDIPF